MHPILSALSAADAAKSAAPTPAQNSKDVQRPVEESTIIDFAAVLSGTLDAKAAEPVDPGVTTGKVRAADATVLTAAETAGKPSAQSPDDQAEIKASRGAMPDGPDFPLVDRQKQARVAAPELGNAPGKATRQEMPAKPGVTARSPEEPGRAAPSHPAQPPARSEEVRKVPDPRIGNGPPFPVSSEVRSRGVAATERHLEQAQAKPVSGATPPDHDIRQFAPVPRQGKAPDIPHVPPAWGWSASHPIKSDRRAQDAANLLSTVPMPANPLVPKAATNWHVFPAQPPAFSGVHSDAKLDRTTQAGLGVETEPLSTARTEQPIINSSSLAQNIPIRMDSPLTVARQIAEAMQQMPGRPVEISLSPEELGRVRLALSSSDAGVIVNVLAERPETMDLLRRHIGMLETAFQNLGYEEIGFSFSSAGGGMDENADTDSPKHTIPNVTAGDPESTGATQVILASGPVTGIDIRL